MTDTELLTAVETALPALGSFDREVYAHARLRLLRGVDLKPQQREQLLRVVQLTRRLCGGEAGKEDAR